MKPFLNFVRLPQNTFIHQQLVWEEALLRTDERNWCLINQGSSPAIVLGISGNAEVLVNHQKLLEKPIPVIRRFSGGGTVVVDENTLFVTLICQHNALNLHPYPQHIMQWTAQKLYQPLLCPFSFELKENDYALQGKKWGGNAQSIIKNRWLHHSSLLWDYCPEKMEYLHMPAKTPAYRQKRSHADFLCRLESYFPQQETFLGELIQQLEMHFDLKIAGLEEVEEIATRPHRKSTRIEGRC